jgi:class 3 adenylate cyclase
MRCPSCQTDNPEAAKFCGECGAKLATTGRTVPPGALDAAAVVLANNAGLAAGSAPVARPTVGERKIVTILFADLVGFTALSETLAPDELRDLMDGWFRLVGDIIPRHGGKIDKFIGDAVMALFGAPVAHEDDPERAIDAALAMQAALADYNRELR